jgi:uncharacterized membrane protein YkvA (DUF1232 family)
MMEATHDGGTEMPVVPTNDARHLDAHEEPMRWSGEELSDGNPALDNFWIAVKRLPKYLKLIANMARDGDVPSKAKAALVAGGAYAVSPVDLIPGIIPVAGQLDDMVVLLLAVRAAVKACPPELAAAHMRRAGIEREDFDRDLAAVKALAIWLAGKGLRASRAMAEKGGRRLVALWQERVKPVFAADR